MLSVLLNKNVLPFITRIVFSLTGLIDVDHDLSYRQWIDGSDVLVDIFEEQRNFPGSIGMVTGAKSTNITWGFRHSFETVNYICSSSKSKFSTV